MVFKRKYFEVDKSSKNEKHLVYLFVHPSVNLLTILHQSAFVCSSDRGNNLRHIMDVANM